MSHQWYTVQVHSSSEKTVQKSLQAQIEKAGLQEQFEEILVPTEEVVELKAGQKKTTQRKIYPGYVFIKMDLTDVTWHLVKSTSKVTGFLGGSAQKPSPINQKDMDKILNQVKTGIDKPRPKVLFEVGESVRIKEGSFNDFNGTVDSVNYDKNKLRVAVTIFGRSTPIELDFGQVEKV